MTTPHTAHPEVAPPFSDRLVEVLGTSPPAASVVDRVAVQHLDSVAVVTLSHPQARNALALRSWERIRTVFTQLASDDDVRLVVVRGDGPTAFAAGADIKEFPKTRMTSQDALHYNESVAGALKAVTAVPVPVVASISGLAVGGGCELATACDVRIVSEDARFGIPIGKLGVILGYTESEAAARLIGTAALKYLLFSGDLIDASDAFRLGLAQKVVPTGALDAATADFVAKVLGYADVTMRAAKTIANMHGRPLTADDTELLHRLNVEAYEGPDLKEGVAAFTEGRAPKFGIERGF